MIGLVLAASVVAGTYTYKTSYQGVDLGTSKVTVTSSANSTHISEQTSGSYSGTSGNATAMLELGGDLTPTSYHASGTMGGSPIADSATVSGDTANVTNAQGATSSFKLASASQHFIVVDLGTLSGFLALPAQMKSWNNASVLAIIPSFGQSLPYSASALDAATRPPGIRPGDVGLQFQGHTPFTVWYDPATLVPDQIAVPSQTLVITRTV